ncbi:hypothetical protein BVG16_05215 [Paenibacillus selenitireducens]|uniref:MmyB-like transcription regulator ligand binding domain-containing protein n=1 Tax=Paenibacillus selenitireducens TaxID=1324314 RepID=A0A1T2XJU7_9BACL|nr:hypothetical protein [Paenibacillus selenitireducens]OPA80147.1 hypothetical protein BVG16_05215 [Paenibacillus selenitireducens]
MFSAQFDLWWPMHEIGRDRDIYKSLNHPVAGQLDIEHTTFLLSENVNLKMYINTPLTGTGTEQKVKQLLDSSSLIGTGHYIQ